MNNPNHYIEKNSQATGFDRNFNNSGFSVDVVKSLDLKYF